MKDFDEKVLGLVKKIPKRKVTTYSEIAKALDTKAYRAVGQTLKRNPNPIKVPCHRVVRSDGSVGGYAGQKVSKKKAQLLRKEGVIVSKGRIDLERFGWRI